MRKALAMGATRGVHVTDPALAGSRPRLDRAVLAAALGTLEYDLVLAGADTSDGLGGVVPAAVAALLEPAVPLVRGEDRARNGDGSVRVRRISPTGYDVLEAPMPGARRRTQALGEPRYPSLKGIMAARSKEIATKSLGGPRPRSAPSGRRRHDRGPRQRQPPARARPSRARAPGRGGRRIVDFLA